MEKPVKIGRMLFFTASNWRTPSTSTPYFFISTSRVSVKPVRPKPTTLMPITAPPEKAT